MSLTPLLKEIQNATDGIENLNAGGCAVFAGIVSRRLAKLGVKVSVRVGKFGWLDEEDKGLLDKCRAQGIKHPKKWNREGVSFGHLIIELCDGDNIIHFDSVSIVPQSPNCVLLDLPLYPGYLTPAECLSLARYRSGWNFLFNRKQIRKLIKNINLVFARANEILAK